MHNEWFCGRATQQLAQQLGTSNSSLYMHTLAGKWPKWFNNLQGLANWEAGVLPLNYSRSTSLLRLSPPPGWEKRPGAPALLQLRLRIREFFESRGWLIQPWERTHTDGHALRQVTPQASGAASPDQTSRGGPDVQAGYTHWRWCNPFRNLSTFWKASSSRAEPVPAPQSYFPSSMKPSSRFSHGRLAETWVLVPLKDPRGVPGLGSPVACWRSCWPHPAQGSKLSPTWAR